MKKFIGFLALMVLSISFSAMGLDPPRNHPPNGHEIVICNAVDQATTITTLEDQVSFFNAERTWQPPGVLYELGVETESVYPYTPTGEMQQNSIAILYVTDQLSDLQPENLYSYTKYKRTDKLSEATFWNYTLFRCDRTRHV